MNKKFLNAIIYLSLGVLLLVSFNNCSGFKSSDQGNATSASTGGSSSNSGSVVGSDSCETDLMNLYQRGYQAFLNDANTCARCHQAGPGKGRFANSDTKIAYQDFMQIGYEKVSSNAINPAHNAPYTGVQNVTAVSELKTEWAKGLADYAVCEGKPAVTATVTDPKDLVTIETSDQATGLDLNLNPKKTSQDLIWTINSDMNPLKPGITAPNAPGGKIQITVVAGKSASGETYYTFLNPKIYGATVGLHIKGIYVKINRQLLRYQTTFRYIDTLVRKGLTSGAESLISTGAFVSPGVLSSQDQISLVFELMEQAEIPDPPPPVTIKIDSALAQTSVNGQGYLDLSLKLSAASTDIIIASLGVVDDTADGTCFTGVTSTSINTNFQILGSSAKCYPEVKTMVCTSGCTANDYTVGRARSIVGTTYNRYDWDYKFSNLSLIFKPGETVQNLRIILSKDIRQEQSRLLSLKIMGISGPVVISNTNASTSIFINKLSNPTPNAAVPTFAELMDPQNGVIGKNCTSCHNSTKLAGEYDISDYELMMKNSVIVPGNPLASKMYYRLNPNTVINGVKLRQMPFDAPLQVDDQRAIEKWILDGAKNN